MWLKLKKLKSKIKHEQQRIRRKRRKIDDGVHQRAQPKKGHAQGELGVVKECEIAEVGKELVDGKKKRAANHNKPKIVREIASETPARALQVV